MIGLKIAVSGLVLFSLALFLLSMPDDVFGRSYDNLERIFAFILVLGVFLVCIGSFMGVWS